MNAPEQRTIDVDVNDLDTRGRTVIGYAARFDSLSGDLGGFRERIAPGAFDAVLASGPDVRALLNHSDNELLGRTGSGTLRLNTDEQGLRFELDLPESPLGRTVQEAVRRSDLSKASFRFLVGAETWEQGVRTVETVKELHDISLTATPAYAEAEILELRTRPKAEGEERTMTDETTTVEETEETEERSAPEPALTTAVLDQAGETRNIDQALTEATLQVRPGENRALTTSIDVSPDEVSSHLFDKLRDQSVMLRAGINVIQTDRHKITFPKLTADVDPAWTAEAGTITPGDPTITTIDATPKKLAHLTILSNEVIEDSEPSVLEVVRQNMLAALGLKLDKAILEGTGASNQPTGLLNVAGTQGVSSVGSIATNGLAPFYDAITALESKNATASCFVVAPAIFKAIRLLEDTTNRPLLQPDVSKGAPATLLGVPLYVSGQIKADGGSGNNESAIYCFDTSCVHLVRRTEVQLDLDRARLFNSDQAELRARMRADVLVSQPDGVWVGLKATA